MALQGFNETYYLNTAEYKLAKATSLFNAGGYVSVAAAQAAFEAARV